MDSVRLTYCMNLVQSLQIHFGYDSFRPLQQEVIEAILNHQDTLMILPTGGGKSLCYQLPSLLMSGVTVVVSPLLALMHDQVVALQANGIQAAMLSSMQTPQEARATEAALRAGFLKLLYVAPERFNNPNFIELLQQVSLNFFVVDEAHCISQWGHEFRQDYRNLSLLKEQFPTTTIAAFTATATDTVEQDIINNLRLSHPKQVRGVVFRPNLLIQAQYRHKNGRTQLLNFLKGYANEAGIIYTLSRKSTETLATFLQAKGLKAKAYHAGLNTKEKNATYADFVADRIQIVVATIAFGMGIDKSNIRFVVHMTMPKTLESYYQEIGRAGRDGLPSETLLLFGNQDIIQQKQFIEPLPNTPYKQHAYDKLTTMVRFANTEVCRHQTIAHYFNDKIEPCHQHCDNCVNPAPEKLDITIEAQKLLSAVVKTQQRFGLHYLVSILKGSKDQRILSNRHDQLSVYGIGNDYTQAQWLSIGDRLLELEAVALGEYKVYQLTPTGIAILKGQEKVSIHEDRLRIKKVKAKKKAAPAITDYDVQLFEQLRSLRREIANEHNIPPYIVFSDRTLKELSSVQPKSAEEMLRIHGIGDVKYERYGAQFLDLLQGQANSE